MRGKLEKPLSSRPILIYFEFRGKPSLINVIICMDPHSPDKLIAHVTKYCFLMIVGDDTSFVFFLSLFFVFMLCCVVLCYFNYFDIINFYRKYFISNQLFFYKKYFNFLIFLVFRDVPGCSRMFRVPGFIEVPNIQLSELTKVIRKKIETSLKM